jgi:hypothetical protein
LIELRFVDHPGRAILFESESLESYLVTRPEPVARASVEFAEHSFLGCVYDPALVRLDSYEFSEQPITWGSTAEDATSPWGWCY